MYKLMANIQKFMYGRYGVDELYKFLFYVCIGLAIVNIFLNNSVIAHIEFLILVVAIYRVLSKNRTMRRKENKLYLKIIGNISKPFINIKRNLDDKEHIYKRCSCGTTMKLPLPKKRGIKHATCPDCKKRVAFLALKRDKIVIIPKNKEKKA